MSVSSGDGSDTDDRISCEYVEQVVRQRFGFVPKPIQVNAIRALVSQKTDLILIAKTGFGKSIVFQAVPLMFTPIKIALIIMPLNALEAEQCKKLKAIAGCRPFVLNGDSNNKSNLELIRLGSFTHGM